MIAVMLGARFGARYPAGMLAWTGWPNVKGIPRSAHARLTMATKSAPLDLRIVCNEEGPGPPGAGCGGWSPLTACAKLSALT